MGQIHTVFLENTTFINKKEGFTDQKEGFTRKIQLTLRAGKLQPDLGVRRLRVLKGDNMISKEKKTAVINEYARTPGDTGSPEVQVAVLTARIQELTEHLKANVRQVPLCNSCTCSSLLNINEKTDAGLDIIQPYIRLISLFIFSVRVFRSGNDIFRYPYLSGKQFIF